MLPCRTTTGRRVYIKTSGHDYYIGRRRTNLGRHHADDGCLQDEYSQLVSFAIAAVAGVITGFAAFGLWRLVRKPSG